MFILPLLINRHEYQDLDHDNPEQVLFSTAPNINEEEQEPNSYYQAVNGPYSSLWQEGIKQELDALHSNNTWTVVPILVGRKIVGSKWVFKLKRDADGNINRYKAHLVVQGFSQQQGLDFDELYALVVRYDSLRLLIALAAYYNWWPQQFNIKAAFLYGDLKEDIHM